MSAESHHQKRALSTSTESARFLPNIVPPQAVSDRSIIDSVAGFINDVALTNAPQVNQKDQILWVKFENLADISDTSLGEDTEGNLPPPLLLCIGYYNGIQVWAIPANGEAIEVMSWKNGTVNILRILPTPFLSNNSELANDLLDQFIHKRPLMALCGDCPIIQNQTSSLQNQQLHAVNFVSLKDGDTVKTIRFKTPIVDIVANRTSIAITFHEKIAIFDARTLEDRLTVTTCYPCPNGLCPIALGDRWLAYTERKLISSKASAGGCYADGIPSYTATVLNAAKSLGKGLRELGEQVAAGLTGNASTSCTSNQGNISSTAGSTGNIDGTQPGIVTILDIKHPIKDISPTSGTPITVNGNDPIIAHFIAHSEAIFAMSFDPSGMLLLTADRRGHDFNVFRIQPHPSGSVLAAVHHLYVLHRGDTSAKVQDISFSFDSRWVAVSTMRGTTHVFPITPYGGQCGYRTHSAPHVVNRLSRFHRSAGLPVDGRCSSPILMSEHAVQSTAYANPRLPPFPHPTIIIPLSQLRQPSSLNSTSSLLSSQTTNNTQSSTKTSGGRQRHHSTEESHSKPLRVAATFAKARSWLLDPPGMHETPSRLHRRPVDSLFVIAGHGALIQYDLEPRHASNIPKEKICDETPIELMVEAKAQWILGQKSNSQLEISPPLPSDNWLIKDRVIDNNLNLDTSHIEVMRSDERDDRWLSQVEIITHAGPHRRLWMGPQFVFKLYNTPSGSSLAHIDLESTEVGARAKSTPVNMPPMSSASTRPLVPVLIESGSCSSHEQSPRLLDSFHYESIDSEILSGPDSQLKEDLADAMRDCPIPINRRESGPQSSSIHENLHQHDHDTKSLGIDTIICDEASNLHTVVVSIVNPQGIITTVTDNNTESESVDVLTNENFILENCDETMFRPVITVLNTSNAIGHVINLDECSKPVEVPLELVVPVIDERVLEEKKKKKREDDERAKARQEKLALESQKAASAVAVIANKEKGEKEPIVVGVTDVKKNSNDNCKVDKKNVECSTGKKEDSYQTKKNKKAQKYNSSNKKLLEEDKKPSKETSNIIKNKTSQSKVEEIKKEIEEVTKLDIEKPITQQADKIEENPKILERATELEPVEVKIISDEGIREISEAVDIEPKIEEISKPIQAIGSINDSTEKSLESTECMIDNKEKPISELDVISEGKINEETVLTKIQQNEPSDKDSWKKGKKWKKKNQQTKSETISKINDFPPLAPLSAEIPSFLKEYNKGIDQDAISKISKNETIGDEEIQIIPHEETVEITDSPRNSLSNIEIIDEIDFGMTEKMTITSEIKKTFMKNNENSYDDGDIDDELPPLEPFDVPFDDFCEKQQPQEDDLTEEKVTFVGSDDNELNEKQSIKKKMSELLKDTNMVFAMCSSLKELKVDEESKSMSSSSHIQRSTSSSLTTNTTTSTFASANTGHDSDYKSIDLELEEASVCLQDSNNEDKANDNLFKIPLMVKAPSFEEDPDISSFEATSSETDDSSKKSNIVAKFKREDDEELRPLLETSITSLSTPSAGGLMTIITNTITTEANNSPTLPETNQIKSQATSNNSGKRKSKKKRR